MPTQRYEVTQPHIETLLAWINSGEIAVPEIQRPFVWQATDVRDFLDSLLRGFPVGYLISCRNPDVKLKDGSRSFGKRILIDGQQRMTVETTRRSSPKAGCWTRKGQGLCLQRHWPAQSTGRSLEGRD